MGALASMALGQSFFVSRRASGRYANAELLSKRILVSARMVGASGCVTASTGSRTSSAVRFLPSSSRACLLLVSYIPLAIPRATHRKC